MDKYTNSLLGLFFIFLGCEIIIIRKFNWRGAIVDFSDPYLHWTIGLIVIGFGIYIFVVSIGKNIKK